MSLRTKKILGISVTIENDKTILEEVRKYLAASSVQRLASSKKLIIPLVIFTPNPEIIIFAQKHQDYKELVNTAQINIPDGRGVAWAMKKTHNLQIFPIPGVDFMKSLCQLAATKAYTIGLIGGRRMVAVEAAECLQKKFQKLKIEVLEEPLIRIRNQESRIKGKNQNAKVKIIVTKNDQQIIDGRKYFADLAKEINRKEIDILFVALGFPKQEYFIKNLKSQISNLKYDKPLVLMSVGGAFDYIAGRVPRAPNWVREAGLEWLYRLIREPWRLGRQWRGAGFFLKILFSIKDKNV